MLFKVFLRKLKDKRTSKTVISYIVSVPNELMAYKIYKITLKTTGNDIQQQ